MSRCHGRRGRRRAGPGGEDAEFGHVGQQGGGGDRSDVGDRAEHLGAPAHTVIGLDSLPDAIQTGQFSFALAQGTPTVPPARAGEACCGRRPAIASTP